MTLEQWRADYKSDEKRARISIPSCSCGAGVEPWGVEFLEDPRRVFQGFGKLQELFGGSHQ